MGNSITLLDILWLHCKKSSIQTVVQMRKYMFTTVTHWPLNTVKDNANTREMSSRWSFFEKLAALFEADKLVSSNVSLFVHFTMEDARGTITIRLHYRRTF